MDHLSERIDPSAALGREGQGEGLLLGSLALVPLVVLAMLVWAVSHEGARGVVLLATVWSGALLCFFAGVRRGLTFSEAGGARAGELVSMLGLFLLGLATLVLSGRAVSLGTAIAGFAAVGMLDAWAARQRQAPRYFAAFRPAQALVAISALAILFIAARP
jgi:hypothetical protein